MSVVVDDDEDGPPSYELLVEVVWDLEDHPDEEIFRETVKCVTFKLSQMARDLVEQLSEAGLTDEIDVTETQNLLELMDRLEVVARRMPSV